MPVHPRPHLTTHNRQSGHSAVAAAAYRMGLKLVDRRTGITHDYSRRADADHIAAFRTVAPPGAPAWTSDPEDLWNRVESSERRKDAQIARDYVLPIPARLGEPGALELAERVARYISDDLRVPVTLALHRNSDTDLQGNAKEVGFHAHLLFPTRRLTLEGDSAVDDVGFGFGEKLTALSNRKTSSAIVERMNQVWAEVANDLALAAGLELGYDHRSYERLGIDRVPQPRLTRGQVAMIKKGLTIPDPSRDILVPSLVYERDHAREIDEQRAHAEADLRREKREPTLDVPSADEAGQTPSAAALSALDVPASIPPQPAAWLADVAAARQRGRLPHAALADRFVAASAQPETDEAGEVLLQLSGLVWAVHRALRALGLITVQLAACGEQIRRWKAARLSDEADMDRLRRQKKALDKKAQAWADDHRWKMWTSRVKSQQPRMLRTLLADADIQQRALDDLKAAQKANAAQLAAVRAEESSLLDQQKKQEHRLAEVMADFVRLDGDAVPVLMAVLPEDQRQRLAPWQPVTVERAPIAPVAVEDRVLVMDRPRPRYRP